MGNRDLSRRGEGKWLIWIGVLALVNFLSWVFGWSFWLY